ncbi:hypothetical protein BZG36_00358 [Bifiguratus adelaidae]|uniref:UDENN domain-containing protein n=1 Tax=Bifiguratus adelaidae TaxID=1938954 RepID=A0A261Y7Q1_9FUNG|nr:hypothetical protein BZG36_00358 [Bifiguratus adelaidae]
MTGSTTHGTARSDKAASHKPTRANTLPSGRSFHALAGPSSSMDSLHSPKQRARLQPLSRSHSGSKLITLSRRTQQLSLNYDSPSEESDLSEVAENDAPILQGRRKAHHTSSSNRSLDSFHRSPPADSTLPAKEAGMDLSEQLYDNDGAEKLDKGTLGRLRNWIIGFCIVNFDLEIGQALDYIYPHVGLSDEERKDIGFLAFPDTNAFLVGDQVFTFRIRSNSSSGFAASGPTNHAGFLYGYVFFRQKKDASIRRGYYQKSIVILSQHPFIGLFSRVVKALGPLFCDHGRPVLEAACTDIASWPIPFPGKCISIPFLGHLLQVELPQPLKPQLLETSPFDMFNIDPSKQILASLPPRSLYYHFQDMLESLWICWELMLLAEPIVVMAPDPATCSEVVFSLVDLINPIPYCGDYRPYFTIQAADFKSIINKKNPVSNLIIGTTNPYFASALEHWPNIIRIGNVNSRLSSELATDSDHIAANSPKNNSFMKLPQGVFSKRKAVIAKDKQLIKALMEIGVKNERRAIIANNKLRRHFVDLTEKFLVPFNRYFSTLIPFHQNLASSGSKLQLRPFQTDQFLSSLKEHGPQLPYKSSLRSAADITRDLYVQFTKCGNFAMWLQHRSDEAIKEIRKRQIQMLCDSDIQAWISDRPEVELVDMLLRYKAQLAESHSSSSEARGARDERSLQLTSAQTDRLQRQMEQLIAALPKDLRESISLTESGDITQPSHV